MLFFYVLVTLFSLAIFSMFLIKISRTKEIVHYCLLTKNNQSNIEGVLSNLYLKESLKGRVLKITIIDIGSEDDTIHILERLARKIEFEQIYLLSPNSSDNQLKDYLETFHNTCKLHSEQAIILDLVQSPTSSSTKNNRLYQRM